MTGWKTDEEFKSQATKRSQIANTHGGGESQGKEILQPKQGF